MILAGDVGGTKTNLGYFGIRDGRLVAVAEETYRSPDYKDLSEIIRLFVKGRKWVASMACFGVAGPVKDGRCEVVNLPWTVETDSIREQLGIAEVHVLNDLEATAFSVDELQSVDVVQLNKNSCESIGNRAVIAAGTGLGESGLYWNGSHHRPFASEGGHATFSPRSKLEMCLAEYLIANHGHASWERVLSGPGLVNIYRFLRERNVAHCNTEIMQRVEVEGAGAISDAALGQQCEVCEQSLNMFTSLYAAEAGNLALKMYAIGGVYIGGGIAAKIISKLQDPAFMKAFAAKGRLRPLLELIPVRVIMTNRAALIGAAVYAHTLLSGNPNMATLDVIDPVQSEVRA